MMRVSPWKSLYAMTWLVFVEFLLAMTPNAPAAFGILHVALGLGIVILAWANFRSVRQTTVPGRVKRTARATAQLSIILAILGGLLVLDVGSGWTILWGVTVYGIVLFAHVVLAITILAQAAAVGIAYDMWEEKEFLAWSAPGEVPEPVVDPAGHAAPAPGGSRRPGAL